MWAAKHCSVLFSSGQNRLCVFCCVHGKKRTTCSGLMKTVLNNVVLPTLFNVVNNIVQHCWAWISLRSGVTMLNNIVDNIEQCGQHNIVQGCFHQPWTGCAFLRVYLRPTHCINSFSNTVSHQTTHFKNVFWFPKNLNSNKSLCAKIASKSFR